MPRARASFRIAAQPFQVVLTVGRTRTSKTWQFTLYVVTNASPRGMPLPSRAAPGPASSPSSGAVSEARRPASHAAGGAQRASQPPSTLTTAPVM